MEMGTAAFAVFLGMAMVGWVAVFTVAVYVVKQYAEKNRLAFKAENMALSFLIRDEISHKQVCMRHKMFLNRFEKYTSREIMAIHGAANVSSILFAITMSIGATCGYFFNRSIWPYSNLIVALLASITMLGYGIYNHLKCRQMKKLSE